MWCCQVSSSCSSLKAHDPSVVLSADLVCLLLGASCLTFCYTVRRSCLSEACCAPSAMSSSCWDLSVWSALFASLDDFVHEFHRVHAWQVAAVVMGFCCAWCANVLTVLHRSFFVCTSFHVVSVMYGLVGVVRSTGKVSASACMVASAR